MGSDGRASHQSFVVAPTSTGTGVADGTSVDDALRNLQPPAAGTPPPSRPERGSEGGASPASDPEAPGDVERRVVREPVFASTAIAWMGYDPDGGRLELEFSDGREQAYHNVPLEVWHQLRNAPSVGRFYVGEIRGVPDYQYASQEEAAADAVRRRCPVCGQFVGAPGHACPGPAAEPPRDRRVVTGRVATYRSDQVTAHAINLTTARNAVGEEPVGLPVSAHVQSDEIPGGSVAGVMTLRRAADGYEVDPAGARCLSGCSDDPCVHGRLAAADLADRLNSRRIRQPDRQRTDAVLADLAADRRASESAHDAAVAAAAQDTSTSYSDHMAAFQAEYTAARDRAAAGQEAVPYFRQDATGGLGARDGGRGFGVELEFDFEPGTDSWAARAAIGRDLQMAGLTRSSRMHGYHSSLRSGYSDDPSGWRLEEDTTVSGELVSPIMYDTPQTWDNLRQACEIIQRHGGVATARTGGHIHVSAGNYDHTVAHHQRLLEMVGEHEDTLYRLAQNPDRSAHRGTGWCRPNQLPADGYRTVDQASDHNAGHSWAVNLQSMRGAASDHVEYRMWDGSLNPGVIQSQINVSLGMTEAAFRQSQTPSYSSEPLGTHRARNATLGRGDRLSGEAWRADTRSFRGLVDTLFRRDRLKGQATALFAITRWQRDR